jgi:hypothetical protein
MTRNRKTLPFSFPTLPASILTLLLLGGCASIEHNYSENYKKLTLSHAQLTHDGLAVLPMNFRYEEESYVKSAQAIFLKNLKGLEKDVVLVEPTEGAQLAKESGAYEAYLQLTQMDLQKEIPRELFIRKVGRALGKRYLLLTELSDTRLSEGATQIKIRAQIWDIEVGEIVWEASEESRGYVVLIFPQTAAPLEKVMEVASIDLIKRMP